MLSESKTITLQTQQNQPITPLDALSRRSSTPYKQNQIVSPLPWNWPKADLGYQTATVQPVLQPLASSTQQQTAVTVRSLDEKSSIIQIANLLNQIKKKEETSTWGKADEMPILPGLFVKDYGLISTPLPVYQAEDLVKRMQHATLDPKKNDIYELNSSDFEFKNPKWNEQLIILTDRVTKELKSERKIEARLEKLCLFKTGSFISKQSDFFNQSPDNLGTLVIQLPSVYAGGDLVIYDDEKSTKLIFDFGNKSKEAQFSINYVVHHADLEYEILKLTGGFRLFLIYSLKYQDLNLPKNVEINKTLSNELYSHLLRHSYSNSSAKVISVLFENKYTSDSIRSNGVEALKGRAYYLICLISYLKIMFYNFF